MDLVVNNKSIGKSLNESPSEKEGKFAGKRVSVVQMPSLNESPSEKEGKLKSVAASTSS